MDIIWDGPDDHWPLDMRLAGKIPGKIRMLSFISGWMPDIRQNIRQDTEYLVKYPDQS